MKKEFKTMGVLALSNLGGIEIEINNTGEYVRYRYYGEIGQRPCKIDYTNDGRGYFRINSRRYYLDMFMSVN